MSMDPVTQPSSEQFRIVRVFDSAARPTGEKEYRVETVSKLTEQEALDLMEKLGSPYKGKRLLPNWSSDDKS